MADKVQDLAKKKEIRKKRIHSVLYPSAFCEDSPTPLE